MDKLEENGRQGPAAVSAEPLGPELWSRYGSRGREIFPLPKLSNSVLGEPPRWKRSRRRLKVRLDCNSRINQLIHALNILSFGGPTRNGAAPRDTYIRGIQFAETQAQREVLARLKHIVDSSVFHISETSDQAALCELFKSGVSNTSYGSRGTVASYFPGGPSLPTAPPATGGLLSALPESWASWCSPERLLRRSEIVERAVSELELQEPYFDPVLRTEPLAYAEYLVSMKKTDMLGWTSSPQGFCAPFFVWKDDTCTSLRALFDCRLNNELFVDPPPCYLTSPEKLAEISIPKGDTLYGTGYDVRDYYHAIKLPNGSSHF